METYRGPQPNILFIMADQWRYDFAGFMGADFVETPNLDRLAARGQVFEQCATTCPVCSPARISLASGLNPERIGALDNGAYLPRSATTYYQRLRDAGYEVGCVGKLDLAKRSGYNGIRGQRPATYLWGFTDPCEAEGKMHAGQSPTPRGPYGHMLEQKGLYERFRDDYGERRKDYTRANADSVLEAEDFEDCWIGRRSADWIRSRTGEYPWHLFVSFVGPHDPYDPPTVYADRYRQAGMPTAAARADDDVRPASMTGRDKGVDAETVAVCRRQYCAAITQLDDEVGRMLAALEEKGELDSTYVIFSSDHGDMMGDLGMWTKSVPYQPSIRVPLIVAGPGVRPGRNDALVSLYDCNASICEMAGLPPQEDIDACSFLAVARGEADGHRAGHLVQIRSFRAWHTHDELFVHHNDGAMEYYDLRQDPHCTRNAFDGLGGEDRRRLVMAISDATHAGLWCR